MTHLLSFISFASLLAGLTDLTLRNNAQGYHGYMLETYTNTTIYDTISHNHASRYRPTIGRASKMQMSLIDHRIVYSRQKRKNVTICYQHA